MPVKFIELETAVKILYNNGKGLIDDDFMFEIIRDLIGIMGEVSPTHLVLQLREHMKANGVPLNAAHNPNIQFPASVYISGYLLPTFGALNSGNDVFTKKANFRMSHRIVSKSWFYQSKTPLLGVFRVEFGDDESSSTHNGNLRIWFAQFLAFMGY